MKWKRSALAILAGCALSAGAAEAQVDLTRPGRVGGLRLPPPLVADTAALDADVAKEDWADLNRRFAAIPDIDQAVVMANWARERLNKGANVLIAMHYVNTVWKIADNSPAPAADSSRRAALTFALYDLGAVIIDGAKCHDGTAVSHRLDQFTTMWTPILKYGQGLAPADQADAKAKAIEFEKTTAPLRGNDPVLCAGGMEQMRAGIAAGTAQKVPTPPGGFGATYAVTPPADFKTQFVAEDQWRPEAEKRRVALPATIDAVFKAAPPPTAAGK